MGRRLIRLFVYEVYRRKLLDHKQLREMRYGMEVIINELYKTLILLAIFTILGKLNCFLLSLLILTTIRCFSGGLHFHTNLSCLLFSVLFFITIAGVSEYLPMDSIYYKGILLVFSTMVIAVLSPIPSVNRKIRSIRRQRMLKFAAVFFTVFWSCILFFYVQDSGSMSWGIATITLQAIQLIVSYIFVPDLCQRSLFHL